MNLSTVILGRTAVAQIQQTQQTAVVEIGRDRLTRADLARVGCYNFVAARLLSAALATLGVRDLQQVYDEVNPKALALPRLGAISLAVLGACFEAKHIGGSAPLESYTRHHAVKPTTWHTLKAREQKAQRQAAQATRRRRRG